MPTGAQYKQLLELEITRLQPQRLITYGLGSPEARYINYAMSTSARRLFSALATRAASNNKHACVREIREFMQISRPAMNQMIDECEAEGWITVERDEGGNRGGIRGNAMILRLWYEYADDLYSRLAV